MKRAHSVHGPPGAVFLKRQESGVNQGQEVLSVVGEDHGLPFWYIRGWDPKLPYQAQMVRQSASLL